jgi:hypothetical protein
MFPQQTRKVRKKKCAPIVILEFWKEKNAKFEKFLVEDSNLCWLFRKNVSCLG